MQGAIAGLARLRQRQYAGQKLAGEASPLPADGAGNQCQTLWQHFAALAQAFAQTPGMPPIILLHTGSADGFVARHYPGL